MRKFTKSKIVFDRIEQEQHRLTSRVCSDGEERAKRQENQSAKCSGP